MATKKKTKTAPRKKTTAKSAKSSKHASASKGAKTARPSSVKKASAAKKPASGGGMKGSAGSRPAGKPLGASQLAALKARLIEERLRLRGRLGFLDDDETSDAANVGDIADAATYLESREIRREILVTDRSQLELVEAALDRLESGSYGRCLGCGLPIENARLDALPEAPTCVACKQKEERGFSTR